MNAFTLMSNVKIRKRKDYIPIILIICHFSFLSPQALGIYSEGHNAYLQKIPREVTIKFHSSSFRFFNLLYVLSTLHTFRIILFNFKNE